MSKQKSKEKVTNNQVNYQRGNLARPPTVFLVCGESDIGKSYRNKKEIQLYMQDDPSTGKKGRKVLAFDTNDDDYPEFKTINPDYLRSFNSVEPRRIRPFNANGSPMNSEDKKSMVEKIISRYRGGLLVLDDIDEYMSGAKGQSMISALCTSRHKNIDLLLTHQSIGKITTTEFQNCFWLRLHRQVDDLTIYKKRIPKYYLVRIAQLIVDEQYELASELYNQGKISKETYKRQSSFFVYVNMRKQKIRGCSKAAFIRACKKYIDQELSKKVRMMLKERTLKDKPIYINRFEVVIKLIKDFLRCYESVSTNPIFVEG